MEKTRKYILPWNIRKKTVLLTPSLELTEIDCALGPSELEGNKFALLQTTTFVRK
jgi:hypothetical protein